VQPALATYNIPFFKECAARNDIKLTVYYGAVSGVPNGTPDGFVAHFERRREWQLFAQELYWQPAQWRHMSHRQADVVSLPWSVRDLSLVPALLRARAAGIPVVLWGHGYSKAESPLRRFFRNSVARLGTALVFYGYRTANQFLKEGWPQEKIYIAPNSLDQSAILRAQSPWVGDPQKLANFQAVQGLQRASTLVCIGRIYSENRLDVLLRALPHIAPRFPDIRLIVIGKVNEHAQDLQHLAKELGVETHVRWLGAIYDERELAPWMLSSTLCCYPENVGLSIMHAMGYGLPVVTGDRIEHHNPEIEVLRDNENGKLFKQGDPRALASAVVELLSDPERLKAMSCAARESVEKVYNIPNMADGFLAAVRYAHKPGRRHGTEA
jgi:glycosyltransferase involved in cell wall biosynthesis